MALQMRQNFDMRMEQKLKLTPQMIQSIEILLLPQMALEERIMQEIESNPVLEIQDISPEDSLSPDGLYASEAADRGDDIARSRAEAMDDLRNDLDHERHADFLKARREARSLDEDAPNKMEAISAAASAPEKLADYLIEQLRMEEIPPAVFELIPDICWQLDRRGYLVDPLEEIFPEDRLEMAEEAWEWVRRCEPAGIGARNLSDCLQLQLAHESGDNSFEICLVRDHLDDLLRNRLPVIAQALEVSVDRVQEGLEAIARLDPAPGKPWSMAENQFVVPDVVVERNEFDEWVVEIPDSRLPKVEINQAYYQLFESEETTARDKAYLREQLGSARFIIDAVAQRKRTLLKIATEIIKHQKAFLEFGPEQLRPLMRQDIADRIGMHVATVSRAVKDKYIQTPGGILPLSTFFSGGIATQDGGEAESSRSVKLKIKALVEKEDPKHPLSDQAIADLLAKEGLDISRRTVTKYRIAENIPSTRQRRSFA
ncbi:MAG: RNA polymerase sigma-54 factor [Planctomycetota bacterium]|nr:MAG: RNA polymerase sigma-54 factor [Planctomycetota bacterium]